jgi:hypothetical protein
MILHEVKVQQGVQTARSDDVREKVTALDRAFSGALAEDANRIRRVRNVDMNLESGKKDG